MKGLFRFCPSSPLCLSFTLTIHLPLSSPSPPPPSCHHQVGGQVDLHGLPGSPSTPSWVRLASTAYAQTSSIVVDADVSAWPVGATVAVASTAIDPNEAETAVIAGGEGGGGWVEEGGREG